MCNVSHINNNSKGKLYMQTITTETDYPLNVAEKIQDRLINTINELDSIINLINKFGPDLVVKRGISYERKQATNYIEEAIDHLQYVDTYLYEYAKNLHRLER